jgi:hypothetical protein
MAATSEEWAGRVKRFLKAELARVDIGYADLAVKLSKMGLPETEGSVTVKINRGTFPAWWCFAVLKAIERGTIRLDDI